MTAGCACASTATPTSSAALIAIVLAAYQDKAPADIGAFDIEALFDELDLLRHLSPTRGNGLRSMVARIRSEADQAAALGTRTK